MCLYFVALDSFRPPVPIVLADLTVIAHLIVDIILSIVTGCSHYGLLVILTLCISLDLNLSLFITAVVTLCGSALTGLLASIIGTVSGLVSLLTTLHFLLTLVVCGL